MTNEQVIAELEHILELESIALGRPTTSRRGYAVRMAIEALKQPEPKKGKWIITDMYNSQVWHCNCSECGKDPQYFISGTEDWWINKLPNFCPNCGIEMEEK